MQLTCPQDLLKRGLAIVGRAVAGKSTLPILSNILLTAGPDGLTLAATNLEIGITHHIGAQVAESGAVTLPAKLLADVVGGLPNAPVTLALDGRTQTVRVTCARFTSHIKGIDADEFPTIPGGAASPIAVIGAATLRDAIDQVAFAAAADDSRPVLAGVLLRLRDRRLTLAAADGFRLAMRTAPLDESTDDAPECVIPARAMSELARIIGDGDAAVHVTGLPGGSQIRFASAHTTLVSRLIDGRFPDFERIIPAQHLTRAVLDTAALASAVKLASHFASASQNVIRIALEPGDDQRPGKIIISANATEVGDNTGEIDALVHGEGGPIALNVKFVTDALAAVGTPQVALEIQSPQSPGVFRPVGADGQVQVIMPMNVR